MSFSVNSGPFPKDQAAERIAAITSTVTLSPAHQAALEAGKVAAAAAAEHVPGPWQSVSISGHHESGGSGNWLTLSISINGIPEPAET